MLNKKVLWERFLFFLTLGFLLLVKSNAESSQLVSRTNREKTSSEEISPFISIDNFTHFINTVYRLEQHDYFEAFGPFFTQNQAPFLRKLSAMAFNSETGILKAGACDPLSKLYMLVSNEEFKSLLTYLKRQNPANPSTKHLAMLSFLLRETGTLPNEVTRVAVNAASKSNVMLQLRAGFAISGYSADEIVHQLIERAEQGKLIYVGHSEAL